MATLYPEDPDVFDRPTPGTSRSAAPTEVAVANNAFDAIEAIQAVLGNEGTWPALRQVYLGTAADHNASNSNSGLTASAPKATMAGALEVLKPNGATKPVGVVWVLPGRYHITAGNEWRIPQRVAVINAQWAHGTGVADPVVVPEAKVVVQPADGETLSYLVALGEPVWNGAATDRWWHGSMFEGIMVWGRENDTTFTGAVDYGIWVHQLGENSTLHRVRSVSSRLANWRFSGTHAGGTIMDLGTWNPGIGIDVPPGTGGIGVLIDDGGLGDGQSGSLHFDHVSGDSRRTPDSVMFRITGSCTVSVNKIKAEGWHTIVDTDPGGGTQTFGLFHVGTLSWNPAVNTHHASAPDESFLRYNSSNSRFYVKVDQCSINSGNPNLLDWSSRDPDAVIRYSDFSHVAAFEFNSKQNLYAAGNGNWGGKMILVGDVSLGQRGYLMDSAPGAYNPFQLWEYTNTGIYQWNNPDADGFSWRFGSDTITPYDAVAIVHEDQSKARLWSRYRMALGGSRSTPDVIWESGTGSPEGVVTAGKGSFYSRIDGGAGTCFYVKESGSGNTGWVAK